MTQHDNLTQDLKAKAHDLGTDAKNAVYSEVENAAETLRDKTAAEITAAANAADAAASKFSADSLQARAAQQVADQVDELATRLRTTDLGAVTRDVSTFARKNPAMFIGGAALIGFAATRFLKARDPQRVDYTTAEGDPWTANSARQTTRGYDVPS